jgi:hypothetical protein
MPDLSKLDSKNILNLMLNRWLGGQGLQADPGRMYLSNLARLIDKALREYEDARSFLNQYVNSGNKTSLLFRCVYHMENCVEALHRAVLHAEKLRRDASTPKISKTVLPTPNAQTRLRNTRHAMLHVDEWIHKGKAGPGRSPIGLLVKSDSIQCGCEEIYFNELAEWITQVQEVTVQLIAHSPSP